MKCNQLQEGFSPRKLPMVLAVAAMVMSARAMAVDPVPGASSLQMSDDIGDAQGAPQSMQQATPPLAPQSTPQAVPATTKPAATAEAVKKDPPGRVRVPYLSAEEKKRIVDEVRGQVMEQAKRENWAAPGSLPAWVNKMNFYGDMRTRFEGDFYDKNNDATVFNFQAINAGAPINTQPPAVGQPITLPFLNTTQNRQQLRLRLRFGVNVDVADGLQASMRLATGNASNPVSANQSFGDDFNKLNFLLDRAYMRYTPSKSFMATLGRMPNPYVTGTDLIWSNELSFDGLSLQWQPTWKDNQFRIGSGMYLVENTDANYPGNSQIKQRGGAKWLFATQLEATHTFGADQTLRADLSFYDYIKYEGKLSSPCYAPNSSVACDTDNSRPGYQQKGNTLIAIRNLQVVNQGDPTYQYFGLAAPFRIASLGLSYDKKISGPLHLAADLDFARNLAFNSGKINAREPVNNLGPCSAGLGTCTQTFDGGNNALQLQFRMGYPSPHEAGQWQGTVGYRRLESDSVVDAFTDADFHLGGTNSKGYYVGGVYSFAHNTTFSARYLAASEVSGPPLNIDVLQFDVGIRF